MAQSPGAKLAMHPTCMAGKGARNGRFTNVPKYSLRGYSVKDRQRALEEHLPLPPTIRVCPARTTSDYVLVRLGNVSKVRVFLNGVKHQFRLKTARKEVESLMHAATPASSHRLLERRIGGIFFGGPRSQLGFEACLARLARARESPGGQEELCARCAAHPTPTPRPASAVVRHAWSHLGRSEHLDEERPGPYWQLVTMLALIDVIRVGDSSVLEDIKDPAPCAICLETLADKGSAHKWLQLEPCR